MVLIGLGVGYFLRKNIAEGKLNQAEQEAERIVANGERMAESKKKEALLEAKEEIHKLRSDVERENKEPFYKADAEASARMAAATASGCGSTVRSASGSRASCEPTATAY
ncbi:MAG: Rnase Y domain-containing protein, partial [Veillonella atypica]